MYIYIYIYCWGCEATRTHTLSVRVQDVTTTLESVSVSLKVNQIYCPREMKVYVHRKTYIQMFIANECVEKWSWLNTVSRTLICANIGAGGSLAISVFFSPKRNLVLTLCETGSVVTSFIWNILGYFGYSENNRNWTDSEIYTEIC